MNRFFKTMMVGLMAATATTAWAGDTGNTFQFTSHKLDTDKDTGILSVQFYLPAEYGEEVLEQVKADESKIVKVTGAGETWNVQNINKTNYIRPFWSYGSWDGTVSVALDVKENGDYTFTLPAGLVTAPDGATNAEYTCTVDFQNAVAGFDLTADVDNFGKVKTGDVITLTVPEGVELDWLIGTECGYVDDPNKVDPVAKFPLTAVGDGATQVCFTVPGTLESGWYIFRIPADVLKTYFVEGEPQRGNAEWSIMLEVEASEVPAEPITVTTASLPDGSEYTVGDLFGPMVLTMSEDVASVSGNATLSNGSNVNETYPLVQFSLGGAQNMVKAEVDYKFAEAGTYTLTIPADAIVGVSGGKNAELVYTYTVKAAPVVGELKIVKITPENGPLAGFNEGEKMTIEFENVGNVTELSLYFYADGEYDFEGYTTNLEGNTFTWESPSNHPFVDGVTYTLKVEALTPNPTGEGPNVVVATFEDAATWTGNSGVQAFQYSDVKLMSVTPDPKGYVIDSESVVDGYFHFDMIFDGAVKVEKVGTPLGQGTGMTWLDNPVMSEEDKVATFAISQADLMEVKGSLNLSVYVYDMEGHPVVKADFDFMGSGVDAQVAEEYSYMTVEYGCLMSAPAIVVDPAAGTVDSLSTFKVYSSLGAAKGDDTPEGIWWGGNVKVSDVQVKTAAGDAVVATVKSYENSGDIAGGVDGEYVLLTLDKTVDQSGKYYLDLPATTFALGQGFSGTSSAHKTVGYTILNVNIKDDFKPTKVDPADKATVESLEKWTVTWSEMFEFCDGEEEAYAYVQDANGNAIHCALSYDMEDFNVMYITLDEKIATDGTYTLVIPAATVGNEAWSASFVDGEHVGGSVNPELNYTYTVKTKTPDEPTAPAQDYDLTVSDDTVVTIAWKNYKTVELGQTVSCKLVPAEGNAIEMEAKVVADAEVATVTLTPKAEVPAGKYNLTIAKASFVLATADGVKADNDEITKEINVETGVAQLFGENFENANVYNAAGMLIIRNASAAQIAALENGLYIVNGKKIIVRK